MLRHTWSTALPIHVMLRLFQRLDGSISIISFENPGPRNEDMGAGLGESVGVVDFHPTVDFDERREPTPIDLFTNRADFA